MKKKRLSFFSIEYPFVLLMISQNLHSSSYSHQPYASLHSNPKSSVAAASLGCNDFSPQNFKEARRYCFGDGDVPSILQSPMHFASPFAEVEELRKQIFVLAQLIRGKNLSENQEYARFRSDINDILKSVQEMKTSQELAMLREEFELKNREKEVSFRREFLEFKQQMEQQQIENFQVYKKEIKDLRNALAQSLKDKEEMRAEIEQIKKSLEKQVEQGASKQDVLTKLEVLTKKIDALKNKTEKTLDDHMLLIDEKLANLENGEKKARETFQKTLGNRINALDSKQLLLREEMVQNFQSTIPSILERLKVSESKLARLIEEINSKKDVNLEKKPLTVEHIVEVPDSMNHLLHSEEDQGAKIENVDLFMEEFLDLVEGYQLRERAKEIYLFIKKNILGNLVEENSDLLTLFDSLESIYSPDLSLDLSNKIRLLIEHFWQKRDVMKSMRSLFLEREKDIYNILGYMICEINEKIKQKNAKTPLIYNDLMGCLLTVTIMGLDAEKDFKNIFSFIISMTCFNSINNINFIFKTFVEYLKLRSNNTVQMKELSNELLYKDFSLFWERFYNVALHMPIDLVNGMLDVLDNISASKKDKQFSLEYLKYRVGLKMNHIKFSENKISQEVKSLSNLSDSIDEKFNNYNQGLLTLLGVSDQQKHLIMRDLYRNYFNSCIEVLRIEFIQLFQSYLQKKSIDQNQKELIKFLIRFVDISWLNFSGDRLLSADKIKEGIFKSVLMNVSPDKKLPKFLYDFVDSSILNKGAIKKEGFKSI